MLRPDVWQCSIYFIQRKCVNTVQTKKTLGANVSPKLRKTNNRTLMSTIPVQQIFAALSISRSQNVVVNDVLFLLNALPGNPGR